MPVCLLVTSNNLMSMVFSTIDSDEITSCGETKKSMLPMERIFSSEAAMLRGQQIVELVETVWLQCIVPICLVHQKRIGRSLPPF